MRVPRRVLICPWRAQPFKADFAFCNHCYVYDPASKARILQMENQMAQFNELQGALFRWGMCISMMGVCLGGHCSGGAFSMLGVCPGGMHVHEGALVRWGTGVGGKCAALAIAEDRVAGVAVARQGALAGVAVARQGALASEVGG